MPLPVSVRDRIGLAGRQPPHQQRRTIPVGYIVGDFASGQPSVEKVLATVKMLSRSLRVSISLTVQIALVIRTKQENIS